MLPLILSALIPPPLCNLASHHVEGFLDALTDFHAFFAPAFRRPEQAAWAAVYLQGLLGNQSRKTIECIAISQHHNVRDLQHFIGQSRWQCDPVLLRHHQLIAETLGDADGVVIINESGIPKQGMASVGVAPQYCGAVGKVTNCLVDVFLSYASRHGSTLADGRLFVPEAWFDESHRSQREACGVPQDLTFRTKPQLALTLLQETVHRGCLPFQWVAVDAQYGDTPQFLDGVAALGKWYFAEVACSTRVWLERPHVEVPRWSGRGRKPKHTRVQAGQAAQRVDTVLAHIPAYAWTRQTLKEGSKGPIVCDFACLQVCEVREGLPGRAFGLCYDGMWKRRMKSNFICRMHPA